MHYLTAFVFALSCAHTTHPAHATASAPTANESGRVMVEITDVSRANTDALSTKLSELDKDADVKEIWIRINSHGGEVDAGFALIQTLESLHKPVTCVADVKAWSMGMSILEGCQTRLMTRRATLMMHEVLVNSVGGNQHDMDDNAAAMRAMTESLVQLAAPRMHMSAADIHKHIDGRQWWLSAEDAVMYHAVDAVIEPSELPPLLALPPPPQTLQQLLGL